MREGKETGGRGGGEKGREGERGCYTCLLQSISHPN